ncbi:hypothetical protein JMG10_34255 [Nostoc ellipsosporum NOK]|nr:hypothetical protein [Nostoc ellipsosporum NOK]
MAGVPITLGAAHNLLHALLLKLVEKGVLTTEEMHEIHVAASQGPVSGQQG